MFDKLGPAISQALTATRAVNPLEATRIIQQALGGASPDVRDGAEF